MAGSSTSSKGPKSPPLEQIDLPGPRTIRTGSTSSRASFALGAASSRLSEEEVINIMEKFDEPFDHYQNTVRPRAAHKVDLGNWLYANAAGSNGSTAGCSSISVNSGQAASPDRPPPSPLPRRRASTPSSGMGLASRPGSGAIINGAIII